MVRVDREPQSTFKPFEWCRVRGAPCVVSFAAERDFKEDRNEWVGGALTGRAGVTSRAMTFCSERYGNVRRYNNLISNLRGKAQIESGSATAGSGSAGGSGPPWTAEREMSPKTRNLFLASLSPSARELIESRTTSVALRHKMRLYRPGQRPLYAYLMTSGIASLVTEMADGASAEVGMIGREGVVGALHILGPVAAPTHCFVQMEGTALRIRLAELRSLFESSKEIRDGILKLVQKEAMVLSQVAGCHRLHSAEERLTRWLLMAQDQTQTNDLHFTQALLANMLGSRRATVTLIAGELQRAGLIRYHRGYVTILDRKGMEEAACGCYQVIKELRGDLYRMR